MKTVKLCTPLKQTNLCYLPMPASFGQLPPDDRNVMLKVKR